MLIACCLGSSVSDDFQMIRSHMLVRIANNAHSKFGFRINSILGYRATSDRTPCTSLKLHQSHSNLLLEPDDRAASDHHQTASNKLRNFIRNCNHSWRSRRSSIGSEGRDARKLRSPALNALVRRAEARWTAGLGRETGKRFVRQATQCATIRRLSLSLSLADRK